MSVQSEVRVVSLEKFALSSIEPEGEQVFFNALLDIRAGAHVYVKNEAVLDNRSLFFPNELTGQSVAD